jgi:hypothetical protein
MARRNQEAEQAEGYTAEASEEASLVTAQPIVGLKFGVRHIQAAVPVPQAVNGRVTVSVQVRTEGSATMVENFTAYDDLGKPYELDAGEKAKAMQALGFPGTEV